MPKSAPNQIIWFCAGLPGVPGVGCCGATLCGTSQTKPCDCVVQERATQSVTPLKSRTKMTPFFFFNCSLAAFFTFLKGQCHKISCFRFFSWIIFPQAPENSTSVISNLFENSRRYPQAKCTTGINDTGGKFATGYHWHRRPILPPVPLLLLIPMANYRDMQDKYVKRNRFVVLQRPDLIFWLFFFLKCVALHREKVELARGLSLELVIDRGKAGAYRYSMSGYSIIMKKVIVLEL